MRASFLIRPVAARMAGYTFALADESGFERARIYPGLYVTSKGGGFNR
jgi:hypothetical protein